YTIVDNANKRIEIIEEPGPSIIIATSGMLEGGPSVQYFMELAPNPKNKILFVSYQVPGTTGRRVLVDKAKQINLLDTSTGKMRVVEVNSKVKRMGMEDRVVLSNMAVEMVQRFQLGCLETGF
ncbi:MAG TPA: beta-CASP ribonuclease aCPSF1, partial [Pyrodictiaceae archaeon]|nr:beta-CASP ribonuclease aCPSF1 [Pyrodictiaceae archaeon]